MTALLALSLTALVPTIDLNDEWVKYFDHRIQFRNDAEFGIEHLNGIYFIEYSVESREAGGISDPEYLGALESFTAWLREQPEVTHVYSYTDIIKRLNKNMHGDDPQWYAIPEGRDLAAQYLLLFELSLPFGLDLTDRINIDKSATRVTATVGELPTRQVRGFLESSQRWLDENAPADMRADPTGATVMFSHISEQNINSMLKGNAVAVLLIALIMMVALRSWRLGALSLIPNVLPILMTFGVWALLVQQVGMAAAMVSATSLGIVVDSTVHFLSKYLRARREKNQSPAEAIHYTFRMVGKALLVNALILTLGFGVLAFSTFRINAEMGLLTALAILIALAVDFLLLPSLLLIAHTPRKEKPTMAKQCLKPLSTLLSIGFLTVAWAVASDPSEPAEKKGYEIAARSDRSDRGFGTSRVDLRMILRNKAGKEARRTLSIATLEIPDESVGDKTLIVFDNPPDIDGTALLSHAKILDPDDQWLFLPALKRVKRISSVNKSGPFVGSEFAFEDFTALELNKFTYRYLREEPCGELVCDVVERHPRYPGLCKRSESE